MIVVVRCLKLDVHEVDRAVGCGEKEYFHDGVISRNVGSDQIQVSCRVNNCKQNLRFSRYTWKKD